MLKMRTIRLNACEHGEKFLEFLEFEQQPQQSFLLTFPLFLHKCDLTKKVTFGQVW